MRRIDHLIVPVEVPPSSDLYVAQPITFETMRRAKERAQRIADIRLLALRFADEQTAIPEGFEPCGILTRSIADLNKFKHKRKLALLKDVLDQLYENSDAEYVIYTNVDIALKPEFYSAVNALIEKGYDAFVINRRTISDAYSSVSDIERMYAEKGKPHPGYDCFVFRRELYPHFVIGDVFLGTGHVDLPLICSMISAAQKFGEFRGEHLTFHIGDKRSWWAWKNRDFLRQNDRAAADALIALARSKKLQQHMNPLVRLMLSAAVLKNPLIVAEWKRMAQASNT
jgi:hypothetical protein